MLPIEVLALLQSDEELGIVRIGPSISHRQDACVGMAPREVLVLEMPIRVDRVSASTIMLRNVTALNDEAIDDAMDRVKEAMKEASANSESPEMTKTELRG